MSLWTAVHQLALEFPEGEPAPIARQFLSRISEDELVDLIANAIETARRSFVREAERDAFSALPADEEEVVEGFDEHIAPLSTRSSKPFSREQFAELLDKQFALGNHREAKVRWGEATVAQHQKRIDMLRAQMQGLAVTIDRHRQAIAFIQEEGVTCLNDVLRADDDESHLPVAHA